MTSTNCEHVALIAEIAAAMRAHGVERYRSGGIEVVLGAPPSQPLPEPKLQDVAVPGADKPSARDIQGVDL